MTAALVGGLHHAGLSVTDVAEAMSRWSHLLGLHGETTPDGRAILRCTYEDYALVLRPATDSAHLDYVCFELASGVTLDAAAERLSACGSQFSTIDLPGSGEALVLRDPDDNLIALTPRIPPADRRPAEVRHSSRIPGWHPRKLGHVNFLTRDVRRQVQWYTDVLGFRVTDWIGTEGVWLHVNADHHVLAFLQKDLAHIHHLAFELVDWGEMRVALITSRRTAVLSSGDPDAMAWPGIYSVTSGWSKRSCSSSCSATWNSSPSTMSSGSSQTIRIRPTRGASFHREPTFDSIARRSRRRTNRRTRTDGTPQLERTRTCRVLVCGIYRVRA